MGDKVNVLVVDDSSFMRKLIQTTLDKHPDIRVVDVAEDPFDAREKIKKLSPDVVTLDIEMPKMDGISFLEKIMTLRPMPVIMVSSLTDHNTSHSLRALELGAVDVCLKPKVDDQNTLGSFSDELIEKVLSAAKSNLRASQINQAKPFKDYSAEVLPRSSTKFIAIGSSTGGTVALEKLLTKLPPTCPPIAIAQHIPPGFSNAFAQRINELSKLDIHEAKDGEILKPGMCVIAPGKLHLKIIHSNSAYMTKLCDSAAVNRHKPSCDVLFDSVTETVGRKALGIILTGMGKDGAEGLKRLRDRGAKTIAQDEHSSLIFGMPKQAIEINAATYITDLKDIPLKILQYAKNELVKK